MKSICEKILLVCFPLFYSFSLFGQSSNLPEWFLKSENYNSKTTAIGISNPNHDSLAAYNEAKMRALLNYSILHDSKVRSLATLSMGDQKNITLQTDNIQFVIYTNIFSGELPILDSIEVVKSYYNPNKEAFVMLKIPSNCLKDSLKFSYSLTRKAAFQREQSNFPLAVDEIDFKIIRNDSLVEDFHAERNGIRIVNANSKKDINFFNDNEVKKKYYYGLSGSISGEQPDNSTLPCPLYTGLWNSFIFNLIDQLCILNQFDEDLQYKLTTANLANLNNQYKNTSYQQFVYTLKNINTISSKANIQKIGVANNQLFFGLVSQNSNAEIGASISDQVKYDKKEIKKLKSENWMVYRHSDFFKAWFESKVFMKNEDYLHSSVDVNVNNLQAGIIEAINIAKLELSSQLGSKINTLNLNNTSTDEQLYLNTSKLSNYKKTGKISPQFIFYSKINETYYRIRVVLFYKLI